MSSAEGLDAAAWGEILEGQKAPAWEGKLPAAAVAAAELETGTEWGSHAFAEYRRCQRAFQLRRRDHLVPIGRTYDRLDYFGIGGAVHAALSYVWGGAGRDPLDALRAITRREGGIGLDEYEEATRLVEAYFAHWGNPDWKDGARVVAVEELLEDASSFSLPYTARLDLILDVGGEIVLVDTKTRAKGFPSDLETYRRRLRSREQFLGQCHLAMLRYGLAEPPRFVVNAIVKTKIPKFDRLSVRITLDDVLCWREAHAAEALCGLAGDAMNYSSCAPELGSPCSYFDYCHGSDEERARGFGRKEP